MNNNNTTYHPLGDYIRKIDKRNRDLSLTKPMGINIDKQFMPSVANVIGTDMSNYKLVEKNQFACNLMHVGRDGKIPVAINKEDEMILVSPAYHVFEIVDENILSPDFLMMWFHREEFDREASFYTDADVRSGMDFKALTEMRIPVPPITEQRAVVADYEAVARRIAVAKRTIATLQATAQALYRKMFVDGIDKENLPEGWRWGTLGEYANCLDYKRCPLSEEERLPIKGDYPYYGAMSVVDHINQYIFDGTYLLFSEDGVNIIDEFGHPALQYLWGKFWVNNHAHVLQGNDTVSTEYLYMALKTVNVAHLVTGAAQPKINQENMNSITILVPPKKIMKQYDDSVAPLFKLLKSFAEEIEKLKEIQTVILSGMGR